MYVQCNKIETTIVIVADHILSSEMSAMSEWQLGDNLIKNSVLNVRFPGIDLFNTCTQNYILCIFKRKTHAENF